VGCWLVVKRALDEIAFVCTKCQVVQGQLPTGVRGKFWDVDKFGVVYSVWCRFLENLYISKD